MQTVKTHISVCHPTARIEPPYPSFPRGWEHSFLSFLERAAHPQSVEYVIAVHESNWGKFWSNQQIFGVDWLSHYRASASSFDWVEYTLVDLGLHAFGRVVIVCNHGRNCVVDQANVVVKAAAGPVIMGGMDDLFPPQNWDTLLKLAIPDPSKEVVLHTRTGSPADDFLFIPQIFTKARFERYGYALHPAYESMFADNEFTEVAKRDGVVIDARHILFEHQHPSLATARPDAVYDLENREQAYSAGLATFEARQKQSFPPSADWKMPVNQTGRKILALCLPGERFESRWVHGIVGLLGYLCNSFIVAPYFGYASDAYVTRQGMMEGILQDAEQSGMVPDYVLWLDDDNVISFEKFARLLQNLEAFKLDMIAGWCHIQGDVENQTAPKISCGMWPDGSPHMYHMKQEHIDAAAQANELIAVDWSGFPCVLMRFDVLKRAGERPFLNLFCPTFKWGKAGEDVSFCRTVKERAGIQMYVDPCVHVPHLKLGDAGRNYYGSAEVKPVEPAKGFFGRKVDQLKQLMTA